MRAPEVDLSLDDIRAGTAFASRCALRVLPTFELVVPEDDRPRRAVEEALAFAAVGGGARPYGPPRSQPTGPPPRRATTEVGRHVHHLDDRLRA